MSIFEKNASSLRRTHDDLSKQIFRIGLVRLVLILLLGLYFTRAFESLNDREVKNTQLALENAVKAAGLTRSNYCGPEFMGQFCYDNRPTVEVTERIDELKRIYTKKFSLDTQVLGVSFSLDLRLWIFAVPYLLIFSEIYLLILRKKKTLISIAAQHNLDANKRETLYLDQLLFHQHSAPFARYPAGLLDYTGWVLILYTTSYVIDASREFWQNTDLAPFLQSLITVALYAIGFYFYVVASLESQFENLFCIQPKKNRIVAAWRKTAFITRKLVLRLKAKGLLSAGSVVTFLSLFLLFGIDSCSSEAARGIRIVSGYARVEHPTSWFGSFLDDWVREVYIAALVIAGVTLLLLLPVFSRRLLRSRVLVSLLYRVSGFIVLYIVSLLSGGWIQWIFLTPLYLGLSLLLWWRFRFAKKVSAADRWPGMRSFLVVLYIPVLMAVGEYFWKTPLGGWPALLGGMIGITMGFMRLLMESDGLHEKIPPPPPDGRLKVVPNVGG